MSGALSLAQPSGRTALAIAAFIARPAAALRAPVVDRCLADVGGHDLRPLLAARPVQAVANRYLSQTVGAVGLDVDQGFLNRLRTRAGLALAIDIALAPFARLDRLKTFVAGAICRDAVRGALLRSDRDALCALFGPEAQEFASRQAATFYPALGELSPRLTPALRSADGTPFADHPVAHLAGQVIAGALVTEAPLAARILAIRETGAASDLWPLPVTPAQSAEVMRLWQKEAR